MGSNFAGKSLLASLLVFALYAFQTTCSRTLQEQLSMTERHEQWMAQHGRVYKDESEKAKRFQIFKENVEYIESINNAGTRPYKLGINQFSDLTNEEFRARYMGFKMPNFLPKSSQSKHFRHENVTEVPQSIDWREQGAVTDVKDQGQCEACWAFSSVAAVEGINQIRNGQLVSLSEQQLLDCDQNNGGCNKGNMDRAFEYIKKNNGLVTESDYPYKESQGTCSINTSPAVTITGHERVAENDESALLNAVANQPVSVGITGSAPAFQSYQSGVFDGEGCGDDMNHAVAIVGYGATEDGTKYWLIKNSWGTMWGEGGYMRLGREVATVGGLCCIAKAASYPTA